MKEKQEGNITTVINKARLSYMKRHYPNNQNITFREVNISSSELFASYLDIFLKRYRAKDFGFYTFQSLAQLCDENFHMILDRNIVNMLLDSNMNLQPEELLNITMFNYTWIYNKNKFYDIEIPEGVSNIFELPLLRIHLNNYITKRDEILRFQNSIKKPFIVLKDIEGV